MTSQYGAASEVDIDEVGVNSTITTESMDKTEKADVNEQMMDVYKEIGDELGIPYTYVKTMYKIAGGKAIYFDKEPSVVNDLTAKGLKAPFEIDGVVQVYDKIAGFIECDNNEIIRPNKYYFPDAAYNVMCSIKYLMDKREKFDRGTMQKSFNNLVPEAKQNIIFYEAVMEYLGYEEKQVNTIHKVYKEILRSKEENEFVSEIDENGQYKIKDKFVEILKRNGINEVENIAILFSFDSFLAMGSIDTNIRKPIQLNYDSKHKSRANMILSASSVVGKVRYVWGGGHKGTSNINGVSPIWLAFNQYYEENGLSDTCIKSSTVHPMDCGNSGTSVKTLDDYIKLREQYMCGLDKFEMLKELDWSSVFKNNNLNNYGSVQAQSVEGLDCSGFVSWVFNQVDNSNIYDSTAVNFVGAEGLSEIVYGEQLLPGDAVGWDTHICLIVGRTDETNKVYIQVEATPNVVRFGVIHYEGATTEQIEYAKKIAREANKIIGNTSENPGVKSLEKLYSRELQMGRLEGFEDDGVLIDGYNKEFKDMKAVEILQYTINNMPSEYLYGNDSYKAGKAGMFNVK